MAEGERPEGGARIPRPHVEMFRELEEVRRSILESSADVLMLADPDGQILDLSRTLGGITLEEAIGSTVFEYLTPDQHAHVRACFERVRTSGRPDRYEVVYESPERGPIYYETRVDPVTRNGQVVAFVLSGIDVSERKAAETALRRSESRLRAFLDSLEDLAFEVDRDGVLLDAWTGDPKNFLVPREELIGKSVLEVHGEERGGVFLAAVRRVAASGEQEGLEYSLEMPEGERFFSARISRIRSEGEQAPTVACLIRDVSERHRAEQERESLIRQLEERNAELERYTYTVSHDLKSPLLTIQGFLGFIEKNLRDGQIDSVDADIERIRSAARQMGRLLDELLELSRVGRIVNPPRAIELEELVHEASHLVASPEGDREIELELAAPLPAVFGDRLRLLQVFQNLIENAVKFGGERPRVEVGARRQGGEVLCWVRDHGLGIEPRYLDRVFGLFEKLDPASSGTGVGLALVKRVVEVHGGRIWVESEGLGRGATFWFTLPPAP